MVSNIVEDPNAEEARQTTNDLDMIVFFMSEDLPNMEDGGIRGFVVKAVKLCEESEVIASFNQCFVKSQSR